MTFWSQNLKVHNFFKVKTSTHVIQKIVNRMKLEVTEWWYHPNPNPLLPDFDFWKIKEKQNEEGKAERSWFSQLQFG